MSFTIDASTPSVNVSNLTARARDRLKFINAAALVGAGFNVYDAVSDANGTLAAYRDAVRDFTSVSEASQRTTDLLMAGYQFDADVARAAQTMKLNGEFSMSTKLASKVRTLHVETRRALDKFGRRTIEDLPDASTKGQNGRGRVEIEEVQAAIKEHLERLDAIEVAAPPLEDAISTIVRQAESLRARGLPGVGLMTQDYGGGASGRLETVPVLEWPTRTERHAGPNGGSIWIDSPDAMAVVVALCWDSLIPILRAKMEASYAGRKGLVMSYEEKVMETKKAKGALAKAESIESALIWEHFAAHGQFPQWIRDDMRAFSFLNIKH